MREEGVPEEQEEEEKDIEGCIAIEFATSTGHRQRSSGHSRSELLCRKKSRIMGRGTTWLSRCGVGRKLDGMVGSELAAGSVWRDSSVDRRRLCRNEWVCGTAAHCSRHNIRVDLILYGHKFVGLRHSIRENRRDFTE